MSEQEIYIEAMNRPDPADRQRFLDEVCGDNRILRDRVEKLIQRSDQLGSFLAHPAVGATQEFGESTRAPADNHSTDPVPLDFLETSEETDSLGRLGRYEILEVVGRGGMGIVLKARDTNLQRIVAVKVLAPGLAANATARKRFLREAQAAAAMSDNHIVTIHAVEENGGSHESSDQAPIPFLVMEFIDGLSLQEKIDQEGPLELKEILRIGRQIASGLAAAHQQGLIHRDIKPANILLQNGVQRVQITDFGLARAADDVGITRTGEVTGTPVYMSPEQAMGQPLDGRSDLFSLGSVLYAMCTGRAPFRADTTIAVLRRVCDEKPRPIRDVTPEIPDSLAAVIDRLLEKNPDHRFQSATEVADLLRKQLANLQAANASPKKKTGVPAEHGTNFSRRQKAWLMAGSILFALVASLGVTEATGVTSFSATVVRIVTGEGTLVVEVADPRVQVTIEGDDGGVRVTGAGPQEVRLLPGSYRVQAARDGRPVHLNQELVTVTRGGRQVVRLSLEPAVDPKGDERSQPEARFDQAIRLNPHSEQAWIDRGAYLAGRGEHRRATEDFAQAFEMMFQQPDQWSGSPRRQAAARLAQWPEVFDRVVELRPDDDVLWLGHARWNHLHERWRPAAADYAKVDELFTNGEEWAERGGLLVLIGDEAGYQSLCRRLAAGFGELNERWHVWNAMHLARACALSPNSGIEQSRITRWAEQGQAVEIKPAIKCHVLALAHYRAGRFEEAVKSLEYADSLEWGSSEKAQFYFLLAMAEHRLGHADQAWRRLAKGQELTRQATPYRADRPDNPVGLPPVDWIVINVLRREAEALIVDQSPKQALGEAEKTEQTK